MQQKTKFIIFITLICFVFLLFLPIKTRSVNPIDAGGGGSCKEECAKMGYETVDYGYGPFDQYKCIEWKPLPPECSSGGTTGDTKEDDRGAGWHCNPTTESCTYSKKQSSGYDTRAQCEAQCIYCRYCKTRNTFLWWSWGGYGCYGIKKCSDNIDKCTINANCNNGGTPTPITKYSCSSSGCVVSSSGGYTTSSCDNKCVKRCVGTSCKYNDNTSNSTCTYSSQCSITSTKYSCSSSGCVVSAGGGYTTSNCGGKCLKRCVGTSCKYNDNTSNGTCTYSSQCNGVSTKYSCNEDTGNCEEDPNGTTFNICDNNCPSISPPPPASTCDISTFSLNGKTNAESDPLYIWGGSVIKGLVSTNSYCETCTVTSTDTWGNDPDPKVYTMTLNNGYKAKEEFIINTSGTYSFTLTCHGSDPYDIDIDNLSLQTVEAINLPWWREIIPVLQGFLFSFVHAAGCGEEEPTPPPPPSSQESYDVSNDPPSSPQYSCIKYLCR